MPTTGAHHFHINIIYIFRLEIFEIEVNCNVENFGREMCLVKVTFNWNLLCERARIGSTGFSELFPRMIVISKRVIRENSIKWKFRMM